MPYRVLWTDLSLIRLEEIASYIALERPGSGQCLAGTNLPARRRARRATPDPSPRAVIGWRGAEQKIGLDDKPSAVTDIAISEVEGTYDLRVPVLRQADGTPLVANFTPRASAAGYDAFPGGIRTALPISTTLASKTEEAGDASEASYLVEVFNAYGNLVWEKTLPQVNGPPTVSVLYESPLEPGMYYQFRATSLSQLGAPLSRTEDLRGVFFVP